MRKTYILNVLPGIKRDGTQFASRNYIDGQWIRFQRQLPRKMGGYKSVISQGNEIIYGIYVIPNNPNFNIYQGVSSGLYINTIDGSGNQVGAQFNRTPVPFPVNANTLWTFDVINSDPQLILAQASQNLNAIDSTVDTPIYYGTTDSNAPLIPTGQNSSGGFVVLHPYVFYYGNSVSISAAADPTTLLISDISPTGQKIVAGLPTRGGNSSPAGLLWSLDSVIRVTFVGAPTYFVFDTVTTQSSMLSSRSVIEYDNLFFWAGTDRFLYYNGSCQEVKNDMNINDFFDNLNYSQRQKVWATKITKFGEIWWHYPRGNSTECNAAVIYNVRENCWYDSSVSRASGYFDEIFRFPLWTDSSLDNQNNYGVWMQETGLNQINFDGSVDPIDWSITGGSMAYCAIGPDGQAIGLDKWVDLYRVEPDFKQALNPGQMTMTVLGKKYANQSVADSTSYIFNNSDVKIDLRNQAREMNIQFSATDTLNSDFQMGQVLLDIGTGDARQ